MNRILIVEDNADNMELISWILEDEGYDFVGVASGEECLEQLSKHDFSLVLMDISLPGLSGKEITEIIRKNSRYQHLPVLACTAHAIKSEEDSIYRSGVNKILTKPIDEKQLIDQLASFLK